MLDAVRALVVDDDSTDLEMMRRLLMEVATVTFSVDTADQLSKAIRALRIKPYDVLLLDLNLPDSSGLATLDAVRSERPDLPIIVWSGLDDEETALRALDYGVQDYLTKGSVTSDMLVRSIRYSIQRHQLLQHVTCAKELLEKKNDRLAELYETAHRFVDNVSHEFRTPLTVIKEYTALIRDGVVKSKEDQNRFLDIVADRADDLNTMVDDMLDVSKIEAGLLGAWRKKCRVSDIVENLSPALERKATVKGVTLELDVDPSLPEVYCDAEKIGRVLINLTVNAVKFCRDDDGYVRIWAKKNPHNPGVIVGVTDNGPGISPEGLSKIFERFSQLSESVRSSCKGFGLGLNIAKELVDLNFGEMDVESELNKGSTFSFTLLPADPVEVMRKYLQYIAKLRTITQRVSLIGARISEDADLAAADDVDSYFQSLLRRNDLVFRIEERRWLLVVAAAEIELDKFYGHAANTLEYINRNRLRGPLPEMKLETIGTWHATAKSGNILARLRQLLRTREKTHV